MSGYRSLDNEEIAFIQSSVEVIYTDFVNLVSKGRNLSAEKVDSIGQGRIWSGADALKIGLADEKGGISEALKVAAAMGEVETYRIVEYPVIKSQIDKIIETLSETGESAKVIANPEMILERAYARLRNESGIKTYARLPFNVNIR